MGDAFPPFLFSTILAGGDGLAFYFGAGDFSLELFLWNAGEALPVRRLLVVNSEIRQFCPRNMRGAVLIARLIHLPEQFAGLSLGPDPYL